MTATEQANAIARNKGKNKIEVGDLALSKEYGAGKVVAIMPEVALYPIFVDFSYCDCNKSEVQEMFNTDGSGLEVDEGDCVFYKAIKLED